MSKASKKRDCPVVNREISAAECGQNRISTYACPAACPFDPFTVANYDVYLELEAGVIHKHLDWFLATSANRTEVSRHLEKLSRGDGAEAQGFQVAEMFFRRDANGMTRFGRWEAAGFPGMKNDERVIQQALKSLRLRLLEVHRVINEEQIEAIDLIDPEAKPLLVCDRS